MTTTFVRKKLSSFSLRRRDRFGPKIVKIRAILAIIRPFDDFYFDSDGGGVDGNNHQTKLNRKLFLDRGPVDFIGKSSNGRKIARIARILTIFGPN